MFLSDKQEIEGSTPSHTTNYQSVKNWRIKYRQKLKDSLGGKCVKCGTSERLEFDHIDPLTKSFDIGKAISHRKISEIVEELKKCQLLCKKCNIQKAHGESRHGSLRKYRSGCRCETCVVRFREKSREYVARYRAKKKLWRE